MRLPDLPPDGRSLAARPEANDDATPLPLTLPSHEVLAQLARDDPAAYEAYRQRIVTAFIDSAPERLKARLSGVQFRVDQLRQLSRSSTLGATVRVYELMWKSFVQLNDVWQDFMPTEGRRPAARYTPKKTAEVLAFRPRLPCDQ